jgi:hypothetical protein
MDALDQHVLVEVLHALLLEKLHFVITVMGLQQLSIQCFERSAKVSNIAWLIAKAERCHNASELPEGSLTISLWVIKTLFAEKVKRLATVGTTIMEIILLHVQEAKVVAEHVE